jgi:hypothetical protein
MNLTKNDVGQRALWAAILASATIGGSYVFACAMPFAALAALAAIYLPRRDGAILILAAWAANQLIGYCVLDYPQTFDSFAWGAMMGISALLALTAGWAVERTIAQREAALAAVFAASFVAYEFVLTAATLVLPAGGGFETSVYAYVAVVNVLAFVGLLALQGAGRLTGLAAPVSA